MAIETPVTQDLDQKQIPYRVFRHPGEVRTLEQAAEERGQLPEQVVRSILFRLPGRDFLMVLIAGPQQISWLALRSYLHQSRITLADDAEVVTVTGYQKGAVSPFGLPRKIRILVDQSVLEPEEISIGSGVRNITIILKSSDLPRALGDFEIGQFSSAI